jgi:hypothetical protein
LLVLLKHTWVAEHASLQTAVHESDQDLVIGRRKLQYRARDLFLGCQGKYYVQENGLISGYGPSLCLIGCIGVREIPCALTEFISDNWQNVRAIYIRVDAG